MKGHFMSHTLTMPEEVDIVLRELQESEIKEEIRNNCLNDKDSWKAGYIPPCRAEHTGEK